MARPTLEDINSGLASWDVTINENNEKLVEQPFPTVVEASLVDLTANFPPALFDACTATVWDGTPGNTAELYVSDGAAWIPAAEPVPPVPPVLSRLAECTLATGDISVGAGALTPTDAFNVSSASKANPSGSMDQITINFTAPVTTPYQVIIEWADFVATESSIHAPILKSKGANSVVFDIWEAVPGVQSGNVKVLILDTTKV